jgi:hypothetical protein
MLYFYSKHVTLRGRWLPDFSGYATYLPGGDKGERELAGLNYIRLKKNTSSFKRLESPEYIAQATTVYLALGSMHFSRPFKIIKISGGWCPVDYEITAVIENVPQNSHFLFDVLLPMHNLLQNQQYKEDKGWGWNNFISYHFRKSIQYSHQYQLHAENTGCDRA